MSFGKPFVLLLLLSSALQGGGLLSYATYLGGSAADGATGVAVDASGNVYVAGKTRSDKFPGRLGLTQATGGVFVTKLNPQGTAILYSTFLGDANAYPSRIAVDRDGNAYVAGYTDSPGTFPATPGSLHHADARGFVAKISPNGDRLVYSALIKPAPEAIAVDSAGNAYLTGTTGADLPVTPGAFQPSHGGGLCRAPIHGVSPCTDAFVMKLNPDGSALVYSTYLGGRNDDRGHAIAVDALGNACVTGETASDDFPVTANAFQYGFGGWIQFSSLQNFGDAFVTKLDPSGSRVVYSTYLGGAGIDAGFGIAADASGNAYVTGGTQSADFPVSEGAFQRAYAGPSGLATLPSTGGDAFAVKLGPSGGLVYSTFLGGRDYDAAAGVAVDRDGNAHVAGAAGAGFPHAAGTFPECRANLLLGPVSRPFVAVLDSTGKNLIRSTGLPGLGYDAIAAIALDPAGAVHVAGLARSLAFFATAGALQTAYGGGDSDAFLARLDLSAPAAPAIACVVNAASLTAGHPSFFPQGELAPGEIVTIFGFGLGPETATGAHFTSLGTLSTSLVGVRVLFDDIPAPLLYVQARQINAIVPFEIPAGKTALVVERDGSTMGPVVLLVAEAVPAIFTLDATGVGQAAVLNENGTINSASNAAPRGSIIAIFAGGAGAMEPPMRDGSVAPIALTLPKPRLGVSALIGGRPAQVFYAGAAPGLVAGALQVNVQVPQDVTPGDAVPVSLHVSNYGSPFGVTMAVR